MPVNTLLRASEFCSASGRRAYFPVGVVMKTLFLGEDQRRTYEEDDV